MVFCYVCYKPIVLYYVGNFPRVVFFTFMEVVLLKMYFRSIGIRTLNCDSRLTDVRHSSSSPRIGPLFHFNSLIHLYYLNYEIDASNLYYRRFKALRYSFNAIFFSYSYFQRYAEESTSF